MTAQPLTVAAKKAAKSNQWVAYFAGGLLVALGVFMLVMDVIYPSTRPFGNAGGARIHGGGCRVHAVHAAPTAKAGARCSRPSHITSCFHSV